MIDVRIKAAATLRDMLDPDLTPYYVWQTIANDEHWPIALARLLDRLANGELTQEVGDAGVDVARAIEAARAYGESVL